MVGHVLQDLLASLFRSVAQLHRDVADCFEGSMSGYFREVTANIAMNSFSLHCTNPALNGISKAVPELSEGCCTRPWRRLLQRQAERLPQQLSVCSKEPARVALPLSLPSQSSGMVLASTAAPGHEAQSIVLVASSTAQHRGVLLLQPSLEKSPALLRPPRPPQAWVLSSPARLTPGQHSTLLLQEKLWRLFNRSQQNDSIPISSQTG